MSDAPTSLSQARIMRLIDRISRLRTEFVANFRGDHGPADPHVAATAGEVLDEVQALLRKLAAHPDWVAALAQEPTPDLPPVQGKPPSE